MVKAGTGTKRTLIQVHSTALIKGLSARSTALLGLGHKATKGQLRELFVSAFLKSLLPTHFGIGSGVVVSQLGEESNQTDVVIYDNTILPPFIQEQQLGVYPADCVCGTIEIKSTLTRKELLKAETAAKKLHQEVFNPKNNFYKDLFPILRRPMCGVFAFDAKGLNDLLDKNKGGEWLTENINHLGAICVLNKLCWVVRRDLSLDESKIVSSSWSLRAGDEITNEETKRFIALVLDNARTRSQCTWRLMNQFWHLDFIGVYIRDQNLRPRKALEEGR